MNPELKVCGRCNNTIVDKRFLSCSVCKLSYDLTCANVPEVRFYNTMSLEHKASWKCVQCKSEDKSGTENNPPLQGCHKNVTLQRGTCSRNPVSHGEMGETSFDMNVSYTIDHEHNQAIDESTKRLTLGVTDVLALIAEMRLFREEQRAMRQELQVVTAAVATIASRLDASDKRVDDLCTRMEALERREQAKTEQSGEYSVAETILQLKAEINDRDQDLLSNDLEISCVPEQKGENVLHVVTTLGQKLGVTLTEQDIVSAVRIGRVPEPAAAEGAPALRPRLIVVRLARRAVRDRLVQEARVRRGATTEGTGLPDPPRRFYVNERLTRVNRQLFQKAREFKDRYNWRFLWTRDGRIYARQRQGEDAPRHRIRTESDLVRVFGSSTI